MMNDDASWLKHIGLSSQEIQELRNKKHELTEYGKEKLKKLTKNKYPVNDWEFVDDIEDGFVEWFNENYGEFSLRCEWFYGDCEVGDEKTRKDLLYKWIHSAYCAGYERGLHNKYGHYEILT